MEFGIGPSGNRISIFNASSEVTYHCPCCGSELVQKHGKIIIPHFAHKSLASCVDYYDNKGPWHRSMQDLFPETNREIYNADFGKHIYDVLTDSGTIIEFQNSSITKDSFDNRTEAYCAYCNEHGKHKPIWVFNYARRHFYVYYKGNRWEQRFRKARWYYPSRIFGDYRRQSARYDLVFRIAPLKDAPEERVVWNGEEEIVAPSFNSVKCEPGYLLVKAIYDDKYVCGTAYTEKEFEQYIRKIGGVEESCEMPSGQPRKVDSAGQHRQAHIRLL